MPDAIRVLVVDDARDYAELVVRFLRACGAWTVDPARIAVTYEDALAAFGERSFDLAFFDYKLGARDGLELIREIRRRDIDTPVVMMTGLGAADIAVEAMKAGAADYLTKTDVSIESIERSVRHALAIGRKERQRREAEAALRASESRFRALAENSSDALLLIDREAGVFYVSPSTERHLGWRPEEMVGRSALEFIHPDEREIVRLRLAETLERPGAMVTQEVRFRHADGAWRVLEGVGVNRIDDPSVGGIVVNARDITDRRRLEEQLRQAQKMEAVGQLAGGIAHDFNNLLTAILGYCNLVLDELRPGDPMRQDMEEIQSAGERAASLTRQLLAFSRRQILQPQTVRLNTLVQQLGKMLRRLISEDVALVLNLADDVVPVLVDPASFEQILVNLAVNARDAMPLGGQLTIETSTAQIAPGFVNAHMPMPPGTYAVLSVGDTGHGMDEATRARIFEPFFTTKEQGKGTGLGLATVYGIVKQSGGYIWVQSEPEKGAEFRVYLPSAVAARPDGAIDAGDDAELAVGWETVMLVEDDDAVRSLAREVLRRQGYVVLEAKSGPEALRVSERHPDDIHLLITDLVMPHMSGRELARRLSVARPLVKMLFMSGYTEQELLQREATLGDVLVQKPFKPEALARLVRRMLDDNPSARKS